MRTTTHVSLYLFCFAKRYGWTTDVTWTILTMSLLPFWALNMSVQLLSIQGQKALRFHEKYLNLCSKDEQRSYRFGTTWGWVIIDHFDDIFGWTIPLMLTQKSPSNQTNLNPNKNSTAVMIFRSTTERHNCKHKIYFIPQLNKQEINLI